MRTLLTWNTFWTAALLTGCTGLSPAPEAMDWYDPGSDFEVEEPVAFTDQNYAFNGPTAIADLPIPGDFETWFANESAPDGVVNCRGWQVDPSMDDLTIEGIVTIHPRFYIKVSGCDSDEKYYGSYYIQDQTGGFFVLGDSRVAHFDMGDRVRLKVRAIKEYFDNVMIAAHDEVDVNRGPEPIYYESAAGRLIQAQDQAKVVRVEGIVGGEIGDFGELYLCTGENPDTELVADQGRDGEIVPRCARSDVLDPPWYKVGIDVELQRRGLRYQPGTRIQVTGPVHLSFGALQIAVMRVGQIEVLSDE